MMMSAVNINHNADCFDFLVYSLHQSLTQQEVDYICIGPFLPEADQAKVMAECDVIPFHFRVVSILVLMDFPV